MQLKLRIGAWKKRELETHGQLLYLIWHIYFTIPFTIFYTLAQRFLVRTECRALPNFRASKSGDGRTLRSSETSFDGFRGSKIVKRSLRLFRKDSNGLVFERKADTVVSHNFCFFLTFQATTAAGSGSTTPATPTSSAYSTRLIQ